MSVESLQQKKDQLQKELEKIAQQHSAVQAQIKSAKTQRESLKDMFNVLQGKLLILDSLIQEQNVEEPVIVDSEAA